MDGDDTCARANVLVNDNGWRVRASISGAVFDVACLCKGVGCVSNSAANRGKSWLKLC